MFKSDQYYYIIFNKSIQYAKFMSYDMRNDMFDFKTEDSYIMIDSDAYNHIFNSIGEEIIESVTDLY